MSESGKQQPLTHLDDDGAARMVDVGHKELTDRLARASGVVAMHPDTLARIQACEFDKGDVLQVARVAGITAAKQTSHLIPLCHVIALSSVDVHFDFPSDHELSILVTARACDRTGVEMEAMTAVSVAALTVYDMCKSIDRSMRILAIQLEEKSGGHSGHYVRDV